MTSHRWLSVSPLVLAITIYLGLALGGIHYGLPHDDHLLSYNPDETTWVEALSQIRPAEGRYNPHPYLAHPTFYLEAYGVAVGVLGKKGWIPLHENKEWFRDHPDQFARFYLAGRYLQVIFGVVLLLTLWWIGCQTFGALGGCLSVLLMSVTPSFIGASHFSQANLPVATMSLLSIAALLRSEKSFVARLKWVGISAFLAGLAISTKPSALPLGIPLLYQCFQCEGRRIRALALSAGLGLLGIFIGTPFAFLAPSTFWPRFEWFIHANLEPVPGGLIAKLDFLWTHPFRHAFGFPLECTSFVAILWHIYKGRSPVLLLWVLFSFISILMAGFIASSGRVLILIPVLLLFVGELLSSFIQTVPPLGYLFALALLVATSAYSVAIVQLHRQDTNQVIASRWIEGHLPAGSRIGLIRGIMYWTPPVVYASAHHPERMKHPYQVIDLKYSIRSAELEKPAYIVLSGPERTNEGTLDNPDARALVQWLDSGTVYHRMMFFPRGLGLGRWRWNRPEYPYYWDDDLWTPSLEIFQRQ